ncbi:hypothetical protein GQ607_009671 [Colletotrichum asianum]|uniref:Uncharacterized protein n=1 Tax=Colletotrichum asianum TaxID=702518 RepID=A0A8H3WC54_9PEZI|nr:hypothetical protein GQ607_009671 [Colletotrichum asianum]
MGSLRFGRDGTMTPSPRYHHSISPSLHKKKKNRGQQQTREQPPPPEGAVSDMTTGRSRYLAAAAAPSHVPGIGAPSSQSCVQRAGPVLDGWQKEKTGMAQSDIRNPVIWSWPPAQQTSSSSSNPYVPPLLLILLKVPYLASHSLDINFPSIFPPLPSASTPARDPFRPPDSRFLLTTAAPLIETVIARALPPTIDSVSPRVSRCRIPPCHFGTPSSLISPIGGRPLCAWYHRAKEQGNDESPLFAISR